MVRDNVIRNEMIYLKKIAEMIKIELQYNMLN
jgi:hypothetical protein